MICLHPHPQFLLDLNNKDLLWKLWGQHCSWQYQRKISGPAQSTHINSHMITIEEVKEWRGGRGGRILLCLNHLHCFQLHDPVLKCLSRKFDRLTHDLHHYLDHGPHHQNMKKRGGGTCLCYDCIHGHPRLDH